VTARATNVLLAEMVDAARRAMSYADGQDVQSLGKDPMRRDAMILQVQIIGEAASRVETRTREAMPEIPWADIVGMRNRLVHGYFAVDIEILWKTVTGRLPELVALLEPHVDV